MISWGSKDQDEVINRSYNWLGRLNGAEIASATLTVVPDTSNITLSNVSNDTTSIYATITGGLNGTVAEILSTIVTNESDPQTLQESIVLVLAPALLLNAGPSTSTKGQLVEMAYEAVALSGYEFDVTPEETFSALRTMDAAMAMDAAQGIRLNYNFPFTFGGGDLQDVSGIPDAAIEYATLRTAKAICSKMGKTLSADAKGRLAQATDMVRAFTAIVPLMPWPRGTPKGAGNALWSGWSPFLPSPGWGTQNAPNQDGNP